MDLNTVTKFVTLHERDDLSKWTPQAAWLGGGTWLFSEPQRGVETLLDLTSLGWSAITLTETCVEVAATCTFAQLMAFTWPTDLVASSVVEPCCRALLGSFKVWNAATVGGNICLALPAGPMTALATALDGIGLIWCPDGSQREVPIDRVVVGPNRTTLAPGEVLRAVRLPLTALRRRATVRRASLSVGGRSAALLIGTCDRDNLTLTITGSTRRPVRLDFAEPPCTTHLRARIDEALPFEAYYDDMHGRPAWRQHLTRTLAEQIRSELVAG